MLTDQPPQAVILAGPNGAGKTTVSRGLVHRWYLYDNEEGVPLLIGIGVEGKGVRIDVLEKWSKLEERYG